MKVCSLYTCGQLGVPAEIEVRDFRIGDLSLLAQLDNKNRLKVLKKVLSSVVVGGDEIVDNLIMGEIKELFINVYAIFWERFIKDVKYTYKDKDGKKCDGYADVDLMKLESKALPKDIYDGFILQSDEVAVCMEYPKLKHELLLETIIHNKYARYFEGLVGGETKDDNVELDIIADRERILFLSCIQKMRKKDSKESIDVDMSVVEKYDKEVGFGAKLSFMFALKCKELLDYGVGDVVKGYDEMREVEVSIRGLL